MQVAQPIPARPRTPPRRQLNAPVLSPNRMPPQDISVGHVGLDVFSPVDQNGSFCFDRVIRSGKVSRRVKKKGAWKASWKPAYLVLRPNLLSIYGNADETDLRESIALSDITAIARVKKSHLDNVFGVFSPSKNYHFLTPSEEETLDWVTHIRLEARTDDMEGYDPPLEPPAPQFSRGTTAHDSSQSHGYDTTDLSADDSPEPAGSPEQRRAAQSKRSRTHSNIEPYNSGPDFNTSHSDFSDFQPGTSLPKSLPNSNNNPLNRPLSPIPSSNALRPSITSQRNPSQLSMNIDAAIVSSSTMPPAATAAAATTPSTDLHRDPLRPIRQGYLTILSSNRAASLKLKTSKTLFAVLRPRNLSFYKDETEYSVLKMLPVSSIIDAVEIDPVSRTRVYCFEVIAEEKVVRCCVRSEGELEAWLGALKSVIVGSRRERVERERVEREAVGGVGGGGGGVGVKEKDKQERDLSAAAAPAAVAAGGPVREVVEGMRKVSVR